MSQLFHAPPQPKNTDERFTPAWVFDGLGCRFDLDPASPRDHETAVPAVRKLTIDDDGLTAPWEGLVWLNPPYSNPTPWADKFIAHGNGIFLGPYANGKWFIRLASSSDLLVLSADMRFIHPEHVGRHAGMALFFAAIGAQGVQALRRLAESGRHPMVPLIPLIQPSRKA